MWIFPVLMFGATLFNTRLCFSNRLQQNPLCCHSGGLERPSGSRRRDPNDIQAAPAWQRRPQVSTLHQLRPCCRCVYRTLEVYVASQERAGLLLLLLGFSESHTFVCHCMKRQKQLPGRRQWWDDMVLTGTAGRSIWRCLKLTCHQAIRKG